MYVCTYVLYTCTCMVNSMNGIKIFDAVVVDTRCQADFRTYTLPVESLDRKYLYLLFYPVSSIVPDGSKCHIS